MRQSKSQEMPAKFRNLPLWRKHLKRPLRKLTNKELLSRERAILSFKKLPIPRPLNNLKLNKQSNSNNFWNNFNRRRNKDN